MSAKSAKVTVDAPVLIEWEDSHYRAGWSAEKATREPLLVRSVGWLVRDGARAKVLCSHISQEDSPQRCGDMAIPSRAIRSIKALVML